MDVDGSSVKLLLVNLLYHEVLHPESGIWCFPICGSFLSDFVMLWWQLCFFFGFGQQRPEISEAVVGTSHSLLWYSLITPAASDSELSNFWCWNPTWKPTFFHIFLDVSKICLKIDGRGGVPLHSATFLQPFLIWGNGQLAGLSQISSMVCCLIGTSPQEGMDILSWHIGCHRMVVKTTWLRKKKPWKLAGDLG